MIYDIIEQISLGEKMFLIELIKAVLLGLSRGLQNATDLGTGHLIQLQDFIAV